MATHELLPLYCLVLEIHDKGLVTTSPYLANSNVNTKSLAPTKIDEDNASWIVLAYSDGTKVRAKYISLKWHHFKLAQQVVDPRTLLKHKVIPII